MEHPVFSVGIEEEYQIIDPHTRELKSYITQILEEGQRILGHQMKPEFQQSMVEIGTTVCRNMQEARSELLRLRREIIHLAEKHGLWIAAAGTHPFSSWTTQDITPLERYRGIKKDMQIVADQLLIFGTHIHIGIPDREFLIEAMNVIRSILPEMLCLSTSSPFWEGRNTGFKSYRTIIFGHFPRTGIPRIFRSWGEFEDLVHALQRSNCIPDGSKLWWDVRPHYKFPTLEIRICDVCTRVDEALSIVAILQAVVYKLWKMRQDNMTFRAYPAPLIEENKWRATRYGLEGNLVDFGRMSEMPARDLIRRLLDLLMRDAADELGSHRELEYAYRIIEKGSSADRQLLKFLETADLHAVVDQLVAETKEGVLPGPRKPVEEVAPGTLSKKGKS